MQDPWPAGLGPSPSLIPIESSWHTPGGRDRSGRRVADNLRVVTRPAAGGVGRPSPSAARIAGQSNPFPGRLYAPPNVPQALRRATFPSPARSRMASFNLSWECSGARSTSTQLMRPEAMPARARRARLQPLVVIRRAVNLVLSIGIDETGSEACASVRRARQPLNARVQDRCMHHLRRVGRAARVVVVPENAVGDQGFARVTEPTLAVAGRVSRERGVQNGELISGSTAQGRDASTGTIHPVAGENAVLNTGATTKPTTTSHAAGLLVSLYRVAGHDAVRHRHVGVIREQTSAAARRGATEDPVAAQPGRRTVELNTCRPPPPGCEPMSTPATLFSILRLSIAAGGGPMGTAPRFLTATLPG